MKVRLLRPNLHLKSKFKVGDVIRRKPLALEIRAQDEWELYDTWWRKLWRGVKNVLSKIFFYHQPRKNPMRLKHVGQ